MVRFARLGAIALLAALTAGCGRGPETAPTLIVNAVVVDGTGAPGERASVRIAGGRILEVGELMRTSWDDVIDAGGLTLAPGFIDTHSHHDRDLFDMRDALAAVNQGITTIVVGQDGGSSYPIAGFFDRLESEPVAVNVASSVGHGTLRRIVMGEDFRRAATAEELAKMEELVREELASGALGLSTGLEYDPGIYSNPSEVLALARVAAEAGGRYASHIRSEDREFWKAIDELIAVGRETGMPVHISHLKLAIRSDWGRADHLLRLLDEARASDVRVSADIYPYAYWQSGLTVLYPERNFSDRKTTEFVLREIAAPEGLLLDRFDPEPSYSGKTVAEIAALRGTDPATTLMALLAESEALAAETGRSAASVIGTSMDEPDIERLMAWPHANICSDGGSRSRHPRGFGAFPRVLGEYVRERALFSLEEAVRKMTTLAAENTGLIDRGAIRPGLAADLVLFDPASVRDRATTADAQVPSDGIHTVWVNGEVVYRDGRTTGSYPGRVLRRPAPVPETTP
jgi:N-acyl-D-amino-acid deacylase